MMNPDGVIHGNYRCSLSGVDLNRKWDNPSKNYHPTVFWTRNLIENLSWENQEIRIVLDLHGHSKKMNSFFYGNPDEDEFTSREFPLIASHINNDINMDNSVFQLSSDK